MRKGNNFLKETLANGIRVVAEKVPYVQSISIGIWVQAGSRDEDDRVSGVSHFAEHMFFKGTRRRNAVRIAQEVDGLGGELNAFTTRENTAYYINILDEHLSRALDILSDIFFDSLFQVGEIERERQVILQELRTVEDDPEDLVHDLHIHNIWRANSLGRPILGNVKTISAITRRDILSYIRSHYQPHRIVISVAGNFSPSRLIRLLNLRFGRMKSDLKSYPDRPEPRLTKRVLVKKKRFRQVHLCLGLKGLPLNHKDRYVLYALNALLGGSMSSRLFQEIREKRGLVYSIYSQFTGFQDSGLFTIYAATSRTALNQVLFLILRELERIRCNGIQRLELNRAVTQMKGSILLGLESTGARMSRLAKDELYFHRYFSIPQTLSLIEGITSRQIVQLARDLFDDQEISLSILGPIDSIPKVVRPILSS